MSTPLKVLIVEDRATDVDVIVQELRRAGYYPDWCRVATKAEYRARLDAALDLILADYSLLQFGALRALHVLQAQGLDVPLIVVTGPISEEAAVECMKQGAADYLLKDRLARLGPAVAQALEQKRLRAERQRAQDQLETSLKEKESLLREIHHRVNNNLQIVWSLLQLQANLVESERDRRIFKESQNRIRSMAVIHQKLYKSRELACVNIADYVRDLVRHLVQSYGVDENAITLRVEADDVSLGIDTAVPCGLILNELVSNALTHAFPSRRGRIRVAFQPTGDHQFALSVADNGVGLPKGLDVRNTESLGWQLINGLAKQLGASLAIANGDGTTVTLNFGELRYKERQ